MAVSRVEIAVAAGARPRAGTWTTLARFARTKPPRAAGGVRILDILQGLPLLVLALVMSAALGPAVHNVIIAISIPIIPRAARVIRSSVLSIREMQYVEAARSLGVRHLRIAFRHILPNTMGP